MQLLLCCPPLRSNAKIRSLIVEIEGGLEAMAALGWQQVQEEGEEVLTLAKGAATMAQVRRLSNTSSSSPAAGRLPMPTGMAGACSCMASGCFGTAGVAISCASSLCAMRHSVGCCSLGRLPSSSHVL